MKNIKKLKTGFFVVGAMLLINIMACDITGLQDSIDDFALVIALEEINTGSSVLLTDAATGEIINARVTVSFEGENGSDVIDIFSDPIEGVDVEEGIFAFGIDNSVVPTPENPAIIRLRLEADGYLPAFKTVEIIETGISDFAFTMINENNKPAGITDINASVATNADGSLTSEVQVAGGDTTNTEFGTSVSIPEGTIFEDENGSPLTGNVNVQLTYYDPAKPVTYSNLPFDTESLVNNEDLVTLLLGVNTIWITDDQGKVASKMYSKGKSKSDSNSGINLTTTFPFITLPSDANILVGDPSDSEKQVSATFTCDSSTNKCIVEASVPISILRSKTNSGANKLKRATAAGGFPMMPSVTVPPPSDQYYFYPRIIVNHNGWDGEFKYEFHTPGMSHGSGAGTLNDDATQTSVNNRFGFLASTSQSSQIKVTSPVEQTYTYTPPNLPTNGDPVTIDLPQKPPTIIDSNLNFEFRCSDPDEKLSVTNIPLVTVFYSKVGENSSSNAWRRTINTPTWDYDEEEKELRGGSVTISNVEQGVDYQLWVHSDGKNEKIEVTISGTEVNVTLSERIDRFCN